MRLPLLFAAALAGLACLGAPQPAAPAVVDTVRAVAFTFDDLPLSGGSPELRCDAPALLDLHDRLLAPLATHGVPAVGFVNEGNACESLPEGTLAQVLTRWLDDGHDLGNHTYSHPDFTQTTVEAYTADVIRGEALTKRLLGERGRALRYFRHPYLRTGETEAKKAALAGFLDRRGYTVASVTLDSDEWVFAAAYGRAVAEGDTATARRVRDTYLGWFDEVVAHYEGWSREVVGYEPPQVLLLHANRLNADVLDELIGVFARRGYRFVSLDEALADPAYAQPDPFVGQYGSSWLHRWARGQGLEVRWEPGAPDWVTAYYRGEG